MATKTRKAAAARAGEESPAGAVSSSAVERPASPLAAVLTTRVQEKKDLQNLNDRLAFYIENVRRLQVDNNRLTNQCHTARETVTVEVNSVKAIYQKEIDDTRGLLDKVSKDKARFELEAAKLGKENLDLHARLKKREKDLELSEKRNSTLDAALEDVKSKWNAAAAEKKRLEDVLRDSQQTVKQFQHQIDALQLQLENETVMRVDLENKMQTAREEIQFKQSLHEQQLNESRTIHEREIEEALGEELRGAYEERLADELHELRESSAAQLRFNRDELERKYGHQLNELQKRFEGKTGEEDRIRTELQTLKSRVDNLVSKNSELEGLSESQKLRIKDLERLIGQEREWNHSALAAKDKEIAKLRDELNGHIREYQDLLDIKIALDMEINAYRKMLEGEETRLSMSMSEDLGGGSVSASGSKVASPRMYATSPRGNKRKRFARDEEETITDIHVDTDCKGDVEIADFDQEGKFVKLLNKGDKDVSLGGWHLIGTSGDRETNFKFHRSVVIKPASTVTVWSSDSEVAHNPPTDILMKEKAWSVGNEVKTVLVNSGEEEVAVRTSKKVVRTVKTFRQSDAWLTPLGLGSGLNGREQKPETCSVM